MIQQEKHGKQSSATDHEHFPCTAAKYVKYGNIKLQCRSGISDQTAHQAQPSVHCLNTANSTHLPRAGRNRAGRQGHSSSCFPLGSEQDPESAPLLSSAVLAELLLALCFCLSAVPQAPVLIKCSAVTLKSFPRANVATV